MGQVRSLTSDARQVSDLPIRPLKFFKVSDLWDSGHRPEKLVGPAFGKSETYRASEVKDLEPG
jgi:hypothetical protein